MVKIKIKKRDKEASKQKLLDAAIDVFSEKGYDAATTKVVALRAGVNESLINRYFGGKQGLLVAMTKDFAENERKIIGTNFISEDEFTTIEDFFYKFLLDWQERIKEKEKMMHVIMSRSLIDPKIAKILGSYIDVGIIPKFQEKLQSLKAKGKIRPEVNIENVSLSIVVHGFIMSFLLHLVIGMKENKMLPILKDFAKYFAAGITA
jgi:AcrR family transcriptional regulator